MSYFLFDKSEQARSHIGTASGQVDQDNFTVFDGDNT